MGSFDFLYTICISKPGGANCVMLYLDDKGSALNQATAMQISHCPSAIHDMICTYKQPVWRQACDSVSAASDSSASEIALAVG